MTAVWGTKEEEVVESSFAIAINIFWVGMQGLGVVLKYIAECYAILLAMDLAKENGWQQYGWKATECLQYKLLNM